MRKDRRKNSVNNRYSQINIYKNSERNKANLKQSNIENAKKKYQHKPEGLSLQGMGISSHLFLFIYFFKSPDIGVEGSRTV